MSMKPKTCSYEKVIDQEESQLKKRRQKMQSTFGGPLEDFQTTKFGLALSGGGIRSAIINLGILKSLNLYDVLRKADYLSTVSGGGYTGAYVQATLKNTGDYQALFQEAHINHMRENGEYLIPGQSTLLKSWNTLILVIAYLGSLVMSLLSPAIVIAIAIFAYRLLTGLIPEALFAGDPLSWFQATILPVALPLLLGTLGLHFIANLLGKFNLKLSHYFVVVESTIVLLSFLIFLPLLIVQATKMDGATEHWIAQSDWVGNLAVIMALVLLGFFTNPNALSFHRFYRFQLARAFLAYAGKFKNVRLANLFNIKGEKTDWMMPYPLINTCLNLQNAGGDDKFKGTKASDYFLLSPLYCGAKLTGYVPTDQFPGYDVMSLPTATTISAAALNPGMGNYSSRFLSILMTIFNARLGYWVNNPLKKRIQFAVWWPMYFFYELFSKVGSKNHKVNISDGGHIENLGVYELLRRKCRLIIAVDGGADPNFIFSDLENLTIRARNELGIELAFRESMIPENVLKVRPSKGYSERRFCVADLYQIWEEIPLKDENGQPELDANGEKVEILVNYLSNGQLEPHVYIKGKLLPSRKDTLQHRAKEVVRQRLDQNPGAEGKEKLKFGTLVYVKSAVTAPNQKPFMQQPDEKEEEALNLFDQMQAYLSSFLTAKESPRNYEYDTYKYKIYHPSFPHESTADQFFDPVQWESYFQLGQFIGAEVLGVPSYELLAMRDGESMPLPLSIHQLIDHFDRLGVEPKWKMTVQKELSGQAETTQEEEGVKILTDPTYRGYRM